MRSLLLLSPGCQGGRASPMPGSGGKESACNPGDTEDADSVPGLGRSPEGGPGNPLQYSCLENPHGEEPGGLQSIESQIVGHN